MQQQLEQVRAFHEKFRSTWQEHPASVSDKTRELRTMLMRTELEEAVEAMEDGTDLARIGKELGDVLYATFGTIGSYGLANRMPEIFDEVHRANMSKDYAGDEDSKAVKGEQYRQANVKALLKDDLSS